MLSGNPQSMGRSLDEKELEIRSFEAEKDSLLRRRAEEDLQRRGDHYRAFIHNATEGIYRIEFDPPIPTDASEDEQYRHIFESAVIAECNDRWGRMYGFETGEETQGRRLIDFCPPDDPYINRAFRDIIRAGYRLADYETRERDRSGTFRYFLNSVVGIVEDGKVVRVWGIQHDITERKQMEEELRKALSEIRKLKERIETESSFLQKEIKCEHNFEEIIGRSDALQYVLYRCEQVAPTDATVLVLGETGTGKELIARAIHSISPCQGRPLLKVSCANFPGNLMESELFGHEKGAFTGAVQRQMGRFEVAHGTTIFLDEIGELPLGLQGKLLRVLQDGEFERIGSHRTIKVNVRVIAATNRDLLNEVRQGRFREDLYYRLNVFPITVPPLRERREDIPLLVRHFLNVFNKKIGKHIDTVPHETMEGLLNEPWPGNIRELRNVIEQAVITAPDTTLRVGFLKGMHRNVQAGQSLEDVERDHIVRTLNRTDWQINGKGGAAALLGLHPSTLRFRMKRLDIQRPGH
ncbi:MAG: sigma 54-interacting transcriptional regulator [bacterium]